MEYIVPFYAILMRTNKFETRLWLNSNFENYDIELKIYFKTNIIWLLDMSF